MKAKGNSERAIFELMLIVVCVGMTYLVYEMGAYKMVALNLFFLPVVLSGYFLGRTSAGVLALFSALAVTIVTTLSPTGFVGFSNPVMLGLALTVWAAVLGLTAILVGTLCDERCAKVTELQEAYVGVVEVLSRYLQSGDPKVKAKSIRVAEMCQAVAEDMDLSQKQMDDIRVGSLLCDLGNVEITTKLISKAMDSLECTPGQVPSRHTFLGMDLVHSLGSVLHGAVPLLMSQDDPLKDARPSERGTACEDTPLGARIIKTVRAFDELSVSASGAVLASADVVVREMRTDAGGEYDPEILDAIERVVERAEAGVSPVHELV